MANRYTKPGAEDEPREERTDSAPEPEYCQNDHQEYWRGGMYVRARAVFAQTIKGKRIALCARCYEQHADRHGYSTRAMLMTDPESIPAKDHAARFALKKE